MLELRKATGGWTSIRLPHHHLLARRLLHKANSAPRRQRNDIAYGPRWTSRSSCTTGRSMTDCSSTGAAPAAAIGDVRNASLAWYRRKEACWANVVAAAETANPGEESPVSKSRSIFSRASAVGTYRLIPRARNVPMGGERPSRSWGAGG